MILRPSGFMTRDWEETPRLALRVTLGVDDSLRATFEEFNVGAGFTFNDHVQDLSDERAAALGLTRPESVWLFGEDGPCRASIGAPYILAYKYGPEVIELGYRIDLCGAAKPSAAASQLPFAPLALVAADAPQAKWVAVGRGTSTKVEGPWSAWTHPRRATFEALGALAWTPDGGESRTPTLHVRERSAGAWAAELGYAWHWPGRECHEREETTLRVGTWAGERFEPLPAFDGAKAHGALVGVLATDAAPLVVIGRLDHQMYLAPWDGARFGKWEERRVFGYPVDDEDRRDVLWSVLEHECVL
ncbi:MAG: hypothetical protein R3A79_26290 [Nannocystaceae bacterium]